MIIVAPVAQIGRLILQNTCQITTQYDNDQTYQKHHRHDARSVSTPPNNGPTTLAVPNDSSSFWVVVVVLDDVLTG
jgi:hypothetical protein